MIFFLRELLNLHKGEEDKEKTLKNVKNNISFTGSNLWILACAIIIASVGLNVNSTAVIIGAMLISPLMSPIVGAGFALGIYDFELLKKSLKNLLIATLAGFLVSSFYFYLSPFKEIQSELLARTSPNIYDVLIAFFGGLVGVIAITRVEKGNPIPGVAIATALMPPLCTAGFGFATGNYHFIFGALFLYAINCVFICISTFAIVKYLKYPAVENIEKSKRKKVRYAITGIIILMLMPSAYFAFTLYKKQQFKQSVEKFIEHEFLEKGNTIIYKKTKYSPLSSNIELAFLNKVFSQTQIDSFNSNLKKYGIQNTKLTVKQHSTNDINSFKNDMLNEINKKEIVLDEKEKQIESLKIELSKQKFENEQIFQEAKAIFPKIQESSIANHNVISKDSAITKTIFIYKSKPLLTHVEKAKLFNWLQKRIQSNKVEIVAQ